MATICLQQQEVDRFPFALPSEYDVQPSKTPPLEGFSSDNEEISDFGDGDGDLLSVKKILAGAENRQPQKWPPESVIDLTYESDNGDDNTVVSPLLPDHHSTVNVDEPSSRLLPNLPQMRHTLAWDNVESILTASEPPLEDAKAVVEERRCSPEIPETPIVAPDDMQPEEGGHKKDDNIPVHICSGAARVAGDGVPEGEASGRDTSYSKHDAGSVEVGKMQQTDRSESSMETRYLDNASSSVVECSGKSRPAIVDVSIFTIVEILGKRSSGFGVEYQFKLEPLWLLTDLIEKSRMRRVHIRRYETRLV